MDNMQEFGTSDAAHHRVPWPKELDAVKVILPTAFISLLSHNLLPTRDEALAVNDFRLSVNEEMQRSRARQCHLAKEISLLQAELVQLKEKEPVLRKQAVACEVVASPFRRLPNDIIYQVIQHCPVYDDEGSHLPTVLSKVSKSWRSTVLGMSHMWKDVLVTCGIYLTPRVEVNRVIKLLNHSSLMSGSLPLSLNLEFRSTTSYDILGPIVGWLFNWDARHRLRGLQIKGPDPTAFVDAVLDYSNDNVGQGTNLNGLTSLALLYQACHSFDEDSYYNEEGDDLSGLDLTVCLERFINLRHLWVEHPFECAPFFADATPERFAFWASLTVLHLSMPLNTMEWRSFLGICPSLEVGWFILTVGDITTTTLPNLDHLPSLKHESMVEMCLHFDQYSNPDVLQVFLDIEFTSLQTLHLYLDFDTEDPYIRLAPRIRAEDLTKTLPVLSCLQIHRTPSSTLWSTASILFPLLLATPSIYVLRFFVFCNNLLEFANLFNDHIAHGNGPLPHHSYLGLELTFERDRLDAPISGEALRIAVFLLGGLRAKQPNQFKEADCQYIQAPGSFLTIRYHWNMSRSIEHDMEEYFERLGKECQMKKLPVYFETVRDRTNVYPHLQFEETFRDFFDG